MNQKLQTSIHASQESLGKLQTAIKALKASTRPSAEEDLLRDALAKRFESAFEYGWRMLKAAAEFQGSDAPGPRPAILEAVRYKWIDDPDWWAQCLDVRNQSVHDYFGTSPESFEAVVIRFAEELEKLIRRLETLNKK